MKKATALLAFGLLWSGWAPARAQEEARIQKLFQDAIQTLGGDAYLQVKDMMSEGNYFGFDRNGATTGLLRFNDYTRLPDKSRFELGNNKKERDVTVFDLEKKVGWIMEGQKEPREAGPEDMEGFRDAVKHSIEMIFRYRYKDPENKLFYLGVADEDVNLEMVKLIDPDNDEVTIYFDRMSKLPAKIEFQDVDGRGVRYRIVQEFSQWHVIQGVNTPLRIDTLANGRQTSQQFIIKISYNNDLADTLFTKPVPPK